MNQPNIPRWQCVLIKILTGLEVYEKTVKVMIIGGSSNITGGEGYGLILNPISQRGWWSGDAGRVRDTDIVMLTHDNPCNQEFLAPVSDGGAIGITIAHSADLHASAVDQHGQRYVVTSILFHKSGVCAGFDVLLPGDTPGGGHLCVQPYEIGPSGWRLELSVQTTVAERPVR